MLDVHAPHKPIHGTGEFFLHLFTITIGLLIAVGIEGGVTRWEHHKLAAEARETMRAEIKKNAANADGALKEIRARRKAMESNIAQVQAVMVDPAKAPDPHLDGTFDITGFEHTAWQTAQATGALSYMPYEEAQRFSGIYEVAGTLEKLEADSEGDEAAFIGVVRQFDVGRGRMSKEAAAALAERFGIWQVHLLQMDLTAQLLQEEQNAYLEGREMKHSLSEGLGN